MRLQDNNKKGWPVLIELNANKLSSLEVFEEGDQYLVIYGKV